MDWIPEAHREAYSGVVLGFLVLLLIYFALKILGSEFHHFIQALGTEIKEASRAEKTVGSINWYQFIVVAVVGVITLVASTGQKIFGLTLDKVIGAKKASELAKYSDYSLLFFVLAILMVISLICVIIDNRRKDDE